MKILIVGLGSIARKHIGALRKLIPDAEIVALRSRPDADTVDGVRNICTLDEAGSLPDFALISNPTSCHAQTVSTLKEHGIPLFIEKPVFDSADHDALVGEVVGNGLLTYVGCNLRFLESLQFLKKYLETHPERRINEVNVYCGSYLPDWRPGADYRKCYSSIPELGGGVHLDLIHELDYVCWLFGMPRKTRGILRNASSLGIRAVDYANYTLEYPGFVASVVLNYYRRDYRRCMEILFDDDTWTLDVKANTIIDSKGTEIYRGEGDIAATYESQMRYFLNLLKTGEKSENDISSAYNILNISLNYE